MKSKGKYDMKILKTGKENLKTFKKLSICLEKDAVMLQEMTVKKQTL